MTGQGLLQLALYVVVLVAAGEAARRLHGRRLPGRAHVHVAAARACRAVDLSRLRRRSRARIGLEALRVRRAAGEPAGLHRRVCVAAPAGRAAPQPAGAGRGIARLVVQHGGQLCDEHQLAGVRRRSDHELPDADAGSRRAEFPVGGSGHRGADRVDPRLRPPRGGPDRQLLGRFHAQHAVRAAAPVLRAGRRARGTGRRAVLRAVPAGDAGRARGHPGAGDQRRRHAAAGCVRRAGHEGRDRHRADAAARPGGEPGGDQAARHERRRVLQRQLGASVREPDAADEFPRGAGDPADPGRPLLHVRQHGQRQAAGLGPAGGHAGDLRAADGRRVRGRAGRKSSLRCTRRRPGGLRDAGRRQHGGQGDALRHRQLRALGDGHDRRIERLGQLDARFVHAARRAGADVAHAAR